MKVVEIFLDDLKDEKRKELLEVVGVKEEDAGNWGVVPIASLEFEDERDEI